MKKVWRKVCLNEIDQVAKECLTFLENPACVFLDGPLGAGKTTFLQKMLPELDVISPTYSLINDYGETLHADVYRIGDKEELIPLELEEQGKDKNLIAIEWAEKFTRELRDILGPSFSYYQVTLFPQNETRDIHFEKFEIYQQN